MRSHQTCRTSQISHFRIKYEVGISFIRAIWEKLDKKTETVAQRCSEKNAFLEIPQNLQEDTCSKVSFFLSLQLY